MDNQFVYGMLSDVDILHYYNRGDIEIYTLDDIKPPRMFDIGRQLQPSSIDLRFSSHIKRFKLKEGEKLTFDVLKNNAYTEPYELKNDENLIIQPGEIILASTLEVIKLNNEFAGIITGRSSIARLGVMVQCCQDFVNPGHNNAIALQLVNLSPCAVELNTVTPVCQLIIFKLSSCASKGYTTKSLAKYKEPEKPTESKIADELLGYGEIRPTSKNKHSLKKILNKYIAPFLPSLIIGTFFTPYIYNSIKDKSIADILKQIGSLPVNLIIAIMLIILYICLRKADNK